MTSEKVKGYNTIVSYIIEVSKYIDNILKEFPGEITAFKGQPGGYSFTLLIEEVAKILGSTSNEIQNISLIVELVNSTVNIHSKISASPETDTSTKLIILSGDLLFAHALEKISAIENSYIRDLIFKKISTVTKADIFLGMMVASQKSFKLDKYQKMARLRSGGFPSLGFVIPAYYSKVNRKVFFLLERIGFSIGMIRQILEELSFFENNTLTFDNVQFWYFPFLALSKIVSWKSKSQSSLIQMTTKDEYNKVIAVNVKKFWKKHENLMQKLPINLRKPIFNACDIYLKDLSLQKWLNYA